MHHFIRLQVYYAIFYSGLTYGCNVWGLASEENRNKIEILQRKCLIIMTFSGFRSHTNHPFIKHNILKVCEIIKLPFNFLNNSLPSDLKKILKLNIDVHSHGTR